MTAYAVQQPTTSGFYYKSVNPVCLPIKFSASLPTNTGFYYESVNPVYLPPRPSVFMVPAKGVAEIAITHYFMRAYDPDNNRYTFFIVTDPTTTPETVTPAAIIAHLTNKSIMMVL